MNFFRTLRRLRFVNAGEGNMEKIYQLMDLFNKYKAIPEDKVNGELAIEIDSFLTPEIAEIIVSPEKYTNGDMLNEIHVKLLELFYAISSNEGKFETRNKIFNLLHKIYKINPHSIDSLHLQNAYLRHLYSIGSSGEDKIISRKLFDVLEYSFDSNYEKISKIKTSSEGKENESIITFLQKTSRAIILFGNINRVTKEDEILYTAQILKTFVQELKYGIFAAQLFNKEYLKLRQTVSMKIVDDFMCNEDAKTKFFDFIEVSEGLSHVLNYLTAHSFPYEIGCYFMMSRESAEELYEVLQSPDIVDIRFKMYVLKILSKMKSSEEDLMFHINNYNQNANSLIRMLTSSNPNAGKEEFEKLRKRREESKGTHLITDEQRKELAEEADTIIKGEIYKERKNPYSNNIDAELLMTAIVLRSSNIADVDIVKSLKKMPDVLSFNANSSGELHEILSDNAEQHDSLLLQDIATGVKIDEKENLRRFLDKIELYITLKSIKGVDIEGVRADIKRQYGIT